MIPTEQKNEVIRYWMEKAVEALASARSEEAAKRFAFAMNRAYYACFYAVSALLLQEGKKFSKHSGVRAAFHQHVVKAGKVNTELGKLYDRLFMNRQESDYLELAAFESAQVAQAIHDAESLVNTVARLL